MRGETLHGLQTLPSICVWNRGGLLGLYFVEERGEDAPGLSQLVTGKERKNNILGARCVCYIIVFEKYKHYNQPSNKVHLIPTEDIQYQPFISVRELCILEEDNKV